MSQHTPPKTSQAPEATHHGQTAPPQQGYPVFHPQFAPATNPGFAWSPGVSPSPYNPHQGQQVWGWPPPAVFSGGEPQPSSLQYPGHGPPVTPYGNPYQINYPHAPTVGGTAAPQVHPSQTPAQQKDEARTDVREGFVRGPVDEGGRQGRGRSAEQRKVKPLVYPGHAEERVAPDEATEEKELIKRLQSWSMDSSSSTFSNPADSTPASGSVMKVTGLSDDVDEDDVADFFENRKRGGFSVERVELDGSSALVYFHNSTAVPSILMKGPFMMKKRKLVVRAHDPTTGESMQMAEETGELPQNKEYACQLLVRSLPKGVDEEDVADFFEHKKRGGFAVEKVELDQAAASAVVHFQEEKAVDAVLQLDSLVWRKQELEVVSYALERKRLEEEALERERELSRMLLVRGLPKDVDEDDVADFFEHKKRGGFVVDKVKLDQMAAKAVIFFQEAKAVETILQMGPLMMHKVKLDVHRYDPSTDSEEGGQGGSRTLLVAGLPAGLDRGGVQEYFESRRRGGFTVDKVELRPGGRAALVHFQEAEAVDAILKKTPHVLKKTTLNICACTPEMEKEFRAQPQDDDTAVSGKGASLILQVTGLPDPVEEEFLTNFFESRRVSGGYGVERVDLQRETHSALVYFEDPEAVKTVLQKAPHLMKKKQISVSAYTEPPKNRGQRKKEKAKKEEEGKEQEEEGSCTVAVRGYGSTSVETLEMYFENSRKSGGEDVQSCTEDEKEKVIYVTFQSSQVAKRVSEKSGHTVGSRKLSVSLHRARPSCPDRVFLSGVPVFVSKESLVNFLEARTKLSVRDVLYGEEEGTALVTFGEKYDLGTLEKALKQRKLEGSEVKARPVAVSDTVLVRGVSPSVSKDTLELYFDNTRKSGGEDVQGVEKLGEETWLVTFADYQVTSRVCERTHHLGGAKLQVSLYVDSLGPEGGDPDPWSFPLPPPLSVPVPHPFLLRFLRENPSQGQDLKEMLAQRHAQARLDDVTALMVTCTLTRETPQGKRLAKTWTEDVQTAVRDFLDRFQISEVQMTTTVFAEVEKEKKKFQPPAEKALVFSEPASSIFVVIGEPKVVEQISKAISDLKKQQEAELERKKQTVTETITLKKHQLKFLEATKFLDDMRRQKGLKIDLDVQANKVVFTGLFSHVKDTQLKMFEFVQNLSSDKIKISKIRGVFLQKNPVASFVLGRLREKKLVAVWELTDNELTLWAATDQDVVQAAHVIKAAVQERTLNLDPESVALLSSKEWSDLVKRTEDQDGRVLITVDKARAEVVLTAVEDRMAAALEEMRNFFIENAVYKQRLSFPPGRQSFMTEHLSSKIHELETNYRAYRVRITFSKRSSDFKLEGTKMGLERVVDGLTALGASISQEKHTLSDKALAEFINSSRGKEALTLVQSTGRCVIRRKGDPTDQPTLTGAGASMGTSQSGIYRLGGSVMLRVTQGDLTKLKVDALVNSANDRLRHVGGLARAISDRAGQSLQKECDAYVSQHGPLKEGEVMVSGAGNLTCKKVIHAVGPRYQGGHNGEEDKLKAAVKGSLKEVHSRGLTSIAMPAISCGVYGYPVKDATQVIVEAMMEFFRDLKTSSLREVVLCDNSPDILTHFHQAAKVLTPLNADDLEDDEPVGGRPNETGGARPRYVRGSSRDHETPGGVGKARAVLGEMALQTVDVIVNTTSSSLNLTHGMVSASLLKAAGPQLQDEVNARYPQGLPPGQHFAVTKAGRLQAKRVYHTSLPDWGNGGEKFLRELLEKCVKEADSQGFSSIAFPALGTGVLNYPRDVVVRHFKEVASSLLPACRSLREIRIVIFPSDKVSVKAFESMMDEGESTGASVNNLVSMQRKPSRLNRSFWTKPTGGSTKSRSAPTQPRKADGRVHAFHINDVVLMVKMGNLVEEDVEAIVNSTNSRIDLRNGAVANAIWKKCGKKLVDECNKPKKQSSMKLKGLTVTPSHGLQSQKIIHVDGDFFKGQWTDVITACLVKASKHKLARVAFPALGTGNRTLKPEDSAMAFIDAIKVMQKSQVKTVKEVRVVIYQPEMFAAFVGTIQKVMTTPEAQSKGWFTKMLEFFTGEISPDGAMGTGQVEQASVDTWVTLYLFSDRPAEIQQALEHIKQIYDRNLTEQEIQHEMIKKFSESEQNKIKNLEEAFKVQAVVDKGQGVVTLKGFSQGVIQAVNEVHKILRDLEQERHLEEGAEVVSNYVQWCYLDESDATTQKKDYDKKTNATLEKAFQKQSPFTKILDNDGFMYVFNFNDMEEYPEEYPDDKVKLLRRDLLQKSYHHALPENWAHMNDDEELKVVPLATTDPEYVDVETEFKRTLNRSNITVTKIARVQNRTLHDQYLAKKQAMEKQNPGIQNEKKLWHGTAEKAIVSINHYGFNRSYCGKNAVVYGNGVYFAVNSHYSTQPTYSPPDKSGDRHIYYVRVLTGEFTLGKGGMRVPPTKKDPILYDSVVDNMSNPDMHIVFNDTQAYPDYLVTFR